jgi:pyruvate dehydrogenase E2 component (dihydrolipoamide acetyltransferase)
MAREFHLPDIGEGLTEATIVTWLVAVGDHVDTDAPLVEVETDKAVVEIPAPVGGVLLHQGAAEGATIAVESLLAVIGDVDEHWSPAAPVPAQVAPIVGRLDEATDVLTARRDEVEALPMVRRLAGELGVDMGSVTGTGPNGRVTEEDVRAAATGTGPQRRVALSATRRAIVRNLTRSWQEIPHVTTYGSADAAALLTAREVAGKPPLEALLISRIVPLLAGHPSFNATFQGDAVVEHLRYDIGFAVDTPEGLMVAVVRDAYRKSLAEIGHEVRVLSAAAKERTIAQDALRGQTFTISNIGAVGGRFGTPIVPYGTTAILGVGRADPVPVVRNGEVMVAREFPLSLSYDHRVIDGASGRAFMADLITALEA